MEVDNALQPTTPAGLGGGTGGLLLGGSVAIAALGSALAYMSHKLAENPWAILVGVIIALLAVMLPISVVAYMKLRRRDLSAILEGSGWAINARMRLTRRQGKAFTQRPSYPPGAKGVPRVGWRLLVAIVAVVAIAAGSVYLVKSCLAEREQERISESANESPVTGETEEPKETPGKTGD